MSVNLERYQSIQQELGSQVTLVAVSKMKTVADIRQLYDAGQRQFGENYVQELLDKQQKLPDDINWHFIGHLQSNKVKYIVPFIRLIHGIDSIKLLKEVNRQAKKVNRVVDVLLQVHIAREATKFGFDANELNVLLAAQPEELHQMTHVKIRGLMGMATFTDDKQQVRSEFEFLKSLYDKYASIHFENCRMEILSIGMSDDYRLAIECGSNMVRIGSLLFGRRD